VSEKEIEAPEDMKPCPFCGESHLLVSDKFEVIPDDDGPGRCSTVVFCESCSSEFELDWHSKSFLEMVWNKRSAVEELENGLHNEQALNRQHLATIDSLTRHYCKDMGKAQGEIQKLKADIDSIKNAIHYPECWDTMAYPTTLDAIREINNCNVCGQP